MTFSARVDFSQMSNSDGVLPISQEFLFEVSDCHSLIPDPLDEHANSYQQIFEFDDLHQINGFTFDFVLVYDAFFIDKQRISAELGIDIRPIKRGPLFVSEQVKLHIRSSYYFFDSKTNSFCKTPVVDEYTWQDETSSNKPSAFGVERLGKFSFASMSLDDSKCRISTTVTVDVANRENCDISEPLPHSAISNARIQDTNEELKQAYNLLKRSPEADVEFIVGTVKIPAHKSMLASHSDHFAAEFNSNTDDPLDRKVHQIVVADISPQAVDLFVQWFYGLWSHDTLLSMPDCSSDANVDSVPEHRLSLLRLALKYHVPKLVNMLVPVLIDRLTFDNVVDHYLTADLYQLSTLQDACTEVFSLYVHTTSKNKWQFNIIFVIKSYFCCCVVQFMFKTDGGSSSSTTNSPRTMFQWVQQTSSFKKYFLLTQPKITEIESYCNALVRFFCCRLSNEHLTDILAHSAKIISNEQQPPQPSVDMNNTSTLEVDELRQAYNLLKRSPKDVEFIVGTISIPAHKSMLAIHSDYFTAEFNSNIDEPLDEKVHKIVVEDISPQAVDLFVQWFYGLWTRDMFHKIPDTSSETKQFTKSPRRGKRRKLQPGAYDNLDSAEHQNLRLSLLRLALKYEVPKLVEFLVQVLVDHITFDNVIDHYLTSDLYQLSTLKDACLEVFFFTNEIFYKNNNTSFEVIFFLLCL